MSSPIVLNAVWGLIAFAAVLLFALAERQNWCVQRSGGRLQRVSAVFIAVCFLFPCVSASDDILGLSTLGSRHSDSSPASKNSVHLERVLQELQIFSCPQYLFSPSHSVVWVALKFRYCEASRANFPVCLAADPLQQPDLSPVSNN